MIVAKYEKAAPLLNTIFERHSQEIMDLFIKIVKDEETVISYFSKLLSIIHNEIKQYKMNEQLQIVQKITSHMFVEFIEHKLKKEGVI